MILTRDTTAGSSRLAGVITSCRMPSTRKRTRKWRSPGSRWMSEAPRESASRRIMFTRRTTGIWSAEARRSSGLVNAAASSSPDPTWVSASLSALASVFFCDS